MAVETRFVVVRNGEELKTFMDKKQADQYDQMLERADALSQLIQQGPISIEEQTLEDLAIYLAEHKEELLVALGAKKASKTSVSTSKKPKNSANATDDSESKA